MRPVRPDFRRTAEILTHSNSHIADLAAVRAVHPEDALPPAILTLSILSVWTSLALISEQVSA